MQYRAKVRAAASDEDGVRDCDSLFSQPALATRNRFPLMRMSLKIFRSRGCKLVESKRQVLDGGY